MNEKIKWNVPAYDEDGCPVLQCDDEVTRYLKACNPDWVDLLMQKFASSAGPWMLHESEVDLIYRAIQNTRPVGFEGFGLDDLELAKNSITSQI